MVELIFFHSLNRVVVVCGWILVATERKTSRFEIKNFTLMT